MKKKLPKIRETGIPFPDQSYKSLIGSALKVLRSRGKQLPPDEGMCRPTIHEVRKNMVSALCSIDCINFIKYTPHLMGGPWKSNAYYPAPSLESPLPARSSGLQSPRIFIPFLDNSQTIMALTVAHTILYHPNKARNMGQYVCMLLMIMFFHWYILAPR